MENKYSSFYHLQIAKCGGTYLNNMIIHNIFNILQKNKIKYIDGEYHLGWQEIPNVYTLSCFRDPVERTVSHYAYYKNGGQNGDLPENVPTFISWVKQNERLLSNYQIKNFLYTKINIGLNPFNPTSGMDPDFLLIEVNKKLAFERIKKTKILLKNSQLNEKTCTNVMQKIIDDFNIYEKAFINKKIYDHNITPGSKDIFNSLNKKEIKYLYELNSLDSEIYFSDNLYFNQGITA
jgi:hypothetical protein